MTKKKTTPTAAASERTPIAERMGADKWRNEEFYEAPAKAPEAPLAPSAKGEQVTTQVLPAGRRYVIHHDEKAVTRNLERMKPGRTARAEPTVRVYEVDDTGLITATHVAYRATADNVSNIEHREQPAARDYRGETIVSAGWGTSSAVVLTILTPAA